MTQSQALKWLKSQSGKKLDYDHVYGMQCVDFFSYYYHYLTRHDVFADGLAVAGAKDLWNKKYKDFKKVRNNPSKVNQLPPDGAILIYNSTWGGGYGHVEVVLSCNTKTLRVIGENEHGNPQEGVVEVTRTWGSVVNGLIGWLEYNFTTTKDVKKTESVPFSTKKVNDPNLAKGTTKTTTKGVSGVRTIITTVTYVNGKQTSSKVKSNKVTKQPVTQVIAVGTKEPNVQPTPTPPKETKPAEPPVQVPKTPVKPPVQEPSTPPASKTPEAPAKTPQAPKVNLWQLILSILKKLLGRS